MMKNVTIRFGITVGLVEDAALILRVLNTPIRVTIRRNQHGRLQCLLTEKSTSEKTD